MSEKDKFDFCLSSFLLLSGWALLFYYGGWGVFAGVFVVVWGNNIVLTNLLKKKEDK